LPPEITDQLELKFIGRIEKEAERYLDISTPRVTRFGFLPHREAIAEMAAADCLLLTFNTGEAHSGKIFEYLASGRPILAISPPDGEVGKLIRLTRSGWCLDATDIEGIRGALRQIVASKKSGVPLWPDRDREKIQAFERPRTVGSLVEKVGLVVEPGRKW
jgi:glycosyltransferase involved in cell wall biosynthesis